jgi:ribosome-binding ATPase
VSLTLGIVGLPNVGKSTLFNALTNNDVLAANYPFATIEPNVGVVPLPDPRLEKLAEIFSSERIVPATVSFVDIAGIVKGASEGAGLGNKFLANIRECDALLHVVRCHTDENVIHPTGKVDPAADIETIETELLLADLDSAERRHSRVVRDARSGDKVAVAEEQWLRQVIEALQAGKPARTVPVPAAAPDAARNLYPLTGKPVLFVANVNEGEDAVPSVVADHAAATGAGAVAISSRIEADLADMGDDEEADAMREELGIGDSGLHRVVNGAFGLLHLIAFFTAGEDKPAQTWHLREGLTAWHAAGEIHSDIQKGFVRAEVIGWDALVDAGGYSGARDKGTLRLEGRDYLMKDGDVLTVKHTG